MHQPAVISLLGFPGWGPLHLHLPRHGNPSALADSLRRVERSHGGSEFGGLNTGFPAAFLRRHPDLEPLLDPTTPPLPTAGPQACYRYRIVCRYGASEPLRICCWLWEGTPVQRLRRRAGPMSLSRFILRFHPDSTHPRRLGGMPGA